MKSDNCSAKVYPDNTTAPCDMTVAELYKTGLKVEVIALGLTIGGMPLIIFERTLAMTPNNLGPTVTCGLILCAATLVGFIVF